jgi:hypothetical protein
MVRKLLIISILMLTASNAFAHDKGDLMLNIEPQFGIAIPDIGVKIGGIAYKDIPGTKTSSGGIDFGVQGIISYYFTNFIGVDCGLGISGYIFGFDAKSEKDEIVGSSRITTSITDSYSFSGARFSIPLGFRLSLKAFTMGAGVSANVPLFADAETWVYTTVTETTNEGWSKTEKKSTERLTDTNFAFSPYMGWYVDIGFDLSGRRNKRGGFGALVRADGSFSSQIASTSSVFPAGKVSYDPFRYFCISVVFQAAIQLASLPIGGK